MARTWVKICGLTRGEQAAAAARLGADAIGLVFADSPRRLDAAEAKDVAAAAGEVVGKVGVFVNAPAERINRLAADIGLTHAQLHGDESPGAVAELDIPAIKAFRVRDEGFVSEICDWLAGLASRDRLAAILLDAYHPDARGGAGERFNWKLLVAAREQGLLNDFPPIILAGGLGPTCVAQAVRTVQPWGVDASTGVEAAPGLKDMEKVAAFLHAARQTDE
jgi:phosphoribosylanthranilate isomerase